MSFYRFNQITGRLSPSQQFKAVVPQGLTPANKLPQASEISTNFPAMNRFRSTFSLAKQQAKFVGQSRGVSSSALPTEFTITGFPKFPRGTKIGKDLVMGEYGPYSPKIRALQEFYQRNPDVPISLKRGASDKIIQNSIIAIVLFGVFVWTPFSIYCLAIDGTPYRQLFGDGKKK